MTKQTDRLRELAARIREQNDRNTQIMAKESKVIAVTSGKGGVGKTSVAVNLAITLRQSGLRVLLIDTDVGLANIDIICGISPEYTLGHWLRGEKPLDKVITEGPGGIQVIAAGSGYEELESIGPEEMVRFVEGIGQLGSSTDLIVIDSGAGLGPAVLNFVLASDEVLVITTPEPTAQADAYVITKTILSRRPSAAIKFVVNRAGSPQEAERVISHMQRIAAKFLNYNLDSAGYVPEDRSVARSVVRQVPFVLEEPGAAAALAMGRIAQGLFGDADVKYGREEGFKGFIRRFSGLVMGGHSLDADA